jgi:hypothetical protein
MCLSERVQACPREVQEGKKAPLIPAAVHGWKKQHSDSPRAAKTKTYVLVMKLGLLI